jgi:hypothetical protein
MFVNFVDGTRQIALNGYAGDGAIQLTDFSQNGLVGNMILNPPGSQSVVFDATSFVAGLVTGGVGFAGFNVREDPANASNFAVMFFSTGAAPDFGAAPELSVDFTAPIPEPNTYALMLTGLLMLGAAATTRKQTSDQA